MADTVSVIDVHNLAGGRSRDAMLMCYDACTLDGQALGWMPRMAYDQARDQQRLTSVWRNDDLVGFMMWGTNRDWLKIYQTWVRKDARMIEHGRALVARVEEVARDETCSEIRLWCAEDLPANQFWEALGFGRLTWRHSPHKVNRRHILWHRTVSSPLRTENLPAAAGTRLVLPHAPATRRPLLSR